jgi:hypothetical protein
MGRSWCLWYPIEVVLPYPTTEMAIEMATELDELAVELTMPRGWSLGHLV